MDQRQFMGLLAVLVFGFGLLSFQLNWLYEEQTSAVSAVREAPSEDMLDEAALSELQALRSEIRTQTGSMESLEARMESIQSTLQNINNTVGSVDRSVDSVDSRLRMRSPATATDRTSLP